MFYVYVNSLNPNDEDAELIKRFVDDGDEVSEGDVIALLESTKSVDEVLATHTGLIEWLVEGDSRVRRKDVLAIIHENRSTYPHVSKESNTKLKTSLFTQPALSLLTEHNVPRNVFDEELVTAEMVMLYLSQNESGRDDELAWLRQLFIDRASDICSPLVIIGAGNHGKLVSEAFQSCNEYLPICYAEENENLIGCECDGLPIISFKTLVRLAEDGVLMNCFVAIGNNSKRKDVVERLSKFESIRFPSLVSPGSVLARSVEIGDGCFVGLGAILGSNVRLHRGSIVCQGSSISHDCILKDFCSVADGSVLGGSVKVGPRALIGINVAVNKDIVIGEDATILSGVAVYTDVRSGEVRRKTG
jgi:sugar O-acyltransferase (sialic acid O-acetyltransferase NeuD family)